VEFIVDADSFDFFFLEMNTRVQVEHPASEMITGADIVAQQLILAGAAGTAQTAGAPATGHAIECRLYAENPARRFYPSPGTMARFDLPEPGPDLRIDTGFRAGDAVTPHYDPLLAKIIARGPTRAQAIDTAAGALAEVRVDGIVTNRDFLIACLRHPDFAAGRVHTRFIDDALPALLEPAA
jgi:3-methylcrotonyl-CoA carboxylase alpha subunit